MDLIHLSSAEELNNLNHPHFGKIQEVGFIKSVLGMLTGTSRKATALEDFSTGQRQAVALHINAENFMVTIAKSFLLVTLREGSARHPVIHKKWKLVYQKKGKGITKFIGCTDTYEDAGGLKWEHRFMQELDEDELVGFGKNGKEILIISLETIR